MPNWCDGYISVRGTNQAEIKRLADAFDAGELLEAVIPVPEELKDPATGSYGGEDGVAKDRLREELTKKYGYSGWYDFCTNRWGTKWDISVGSECDRDEDGLGFNGNFQTAWAPPIPVMEALVENGFEVTLYYNESGMAFVGKFEDGVDECFEYSNESSTTVRDTIGEELDDFYGISEQMAEYEAEQEQEELTEWLKDGIEKRELVTGPAAL